MLMAAGVVTTIPCCALPARQRVCAFSTLGFLPVHWPDADVPAGGGVYGEVPGADKMVTFAFIWVALAILLRMRFIPAQGAQRAVMLPSLNSLPQGRGFPVI